jgi:DNA-binding transcriptional ArsR family regulator
MPDIIRALNTPRRREILRTIWKQERSVGEICKAHPEITYGAVSQHLRVLEHAGLVSKRQEGLYRYYKACPEELGSLRDWLETMWESVLYRLKIRAELEQARRGPRGRKRKRRIR